MATFIYHLLIAGCRLPVANCRLTSHQLPIDPLGNKFHKNCILYFVDASFHRSAEEFFIKEYFGIILSVFQGEIFLFTLK